MTDKAHKDKEKGNLAFKAGDYPTAIGHYTEAILRDRSDATFPLNRAAAYLKLGKYEDAEKDCSTVLSLSIQNVKAYFRRGQARVSLGRFIEAQRDFTEVLRLEPDNKTAKEELGKVAKFIEVEKRKKLDRREANKSTLDPETPPKRRRVPITIVEPPMASTSLEQSNKAGWLKTMQPQSASVGIQGVSSRTLELSSPQSPDSRLKSSSSGFLASATPAASSTDRPLTSLAPPEKFTSPPVTPEPSSRSSSFVEAKQVRQTKFGKVGGGIFHASGQSTIFPTRMGTEKDGTLSPARSQPLDTAGNKSSSSASATSASATEPVLNSNGSTNQSHGVLIEAPATLFDMVRTWRSMLTSTERWNLLQTIPPSTIPSFCNTSLEPPLLTSILEVFLVVLSSLPTKEDKVKIREYMENMAQVPRFSTLILFLTSKEKAIAKEVWKKLVVSGKAPGAWSSLGDL